MTKTGNFRQPGAALDIKNGHIDLSHGSGGRAMAQLINTLFVKHFDNELLRQGNDQALFNIEAGRMVMSTDSHVITPPLSAPDGMIVSRRRREICQSEVRDSARGRLKFYPE